MSSAILGFSKSECSELISSAYNSVAWYLKLSTQSDLNKDYWLERAAKAEAVADKLDAYCKEVYF